MRHEDTEGLTNSIAAVSRMLTGPSEKIRPTRYCAVPGLVCILVGALLFCVAPPAPGEERTQRRHDQISGSTTASIFSATQDADGFLWVGIEGGGLARFDGREFRRWAPDKLTTHILFARAAGEELVLIVEPEVGSQAGNGLCRIVGDGVEQITGPDGQPWTGVRDAAYDARHRLWVARPNELFFRGERGEWTRIPIDPPAGDRIRRLAANRDDGVFVVTSGGIQSVDGGGVVSNIVRTPRAADVIDRGDGSIFYAEMKPTGGGIFELRDGQSTQLVFLEARFNLFILRGRTVWAVFDSGMVALRAGEQPETLGPADGVPGGAAFVDREGSLWVGTAEGLLQIPEPETVMWNQKDGLPLASARYLAKTEEGVWVATWGGLCRLTSTGGKWKVVVEEKLEHKWPMMVDGEGRLWGKHRDTFLQRVGGRFRKYAVPDSGIIQSSARASDGTVWIGTDRGLFKTNRSESAPVRFGMPPGVDSVDQVFEDSRGELWVTSGNRICHAPAAAVASDGQAQWIRDEIEGLQGFSRLTQTARGEIWAARWLGGGVWRYDSGRWKAIPASEKLPAAVVSNLIPAQTGGMWVLGKGFVLRVAERPDLLDGWEVVEEVNVWQGLPQTVISDLIEQPDGTLWIATAAGVVRIRSDARRAPSEPPRIKQTAFIVNGRLLESGVAPRLGYDSNQIELHFAALSYRSPGLLKYQYRLRPDEAWTDSKSEEPVFRFFDLRPGKYAAEVRASLDGANWSSQSARIDFEVLSPWYLRWWAIAAMLLLIGVVLLAAHRARVEVLVRLERQRTLIAMDLHDEIGSGLGSIGILSGVAASESVKDDQRRELARNIVDTAAELGSALTDIVWSLHPDSASLEGLADRLTQRGYRLFPDGSPTFKTDFPQHWPIVDLSLAARHNLLLIGTEALHNAARHAKAQQVELGIAQAGSAWRFWVTDDGHGIGSNGQNHDHSGLGLITMRKRAEEIGAEINWSSADGIGTTVSVIFSPASKDRRAK